MISFFQDIFEIFLSLTQYCEEYVVVQLQTREASYVTTVFVSLSSSCITVGLSRHLSSEGYTGLPD